jgi:hypothetical protein
LKTRHRGFFYACAPAWRSRYWRGEHAMTRLKAWLKALSES